MLPLYLSLEGLYSYQKKQAIDFTKLTEAGLFGIFGTVGSGKSSILEAISFVLYGDTERLNRTDKRAYNMLNLKSNQATIVFDFLNFERRKFRFVCQWKRRKNFIDTTPFERIAYEWKEGDWQPLESADATKVTNLSYANFRRTIIIPQGQFKEFLDLRGKDRSEMMKEIFYLGKFDLGPKVGFLQAQNNRKLEHLKGALSGYETISKVALEEKKREVQEAKQTLIKTRAGYEELLEKVQALQEVRDKGTELRQKEIQFKELNARKVRIQQQEDELNRYENTSKAFVEPLNLIQSLNAERDVLIHKIENFQSERESRFTQIDRLEKKIDLIKSDYLNINSLRVEAEDYRYIEKILESQQKEAELERRLTKGCPIVEQAKAKHVELKEKLKTVETTLQELRAEKVDASQMMEMERWYQKNKSFHQQQERQTKQTKQLNDEIQEQLDLFQKEGYTPENWESLLDKEFGLIDQKQRQLLDQQTHLQVQAKFAHFATELTPGSPCPLCGAFEHPQPMVGDQLHIELQGIEKDRANLEAQRVDFQTLKTKLTRASITLQSKRTHLDQLQTESQALSEEMDQHGLQFNWRGYSADNIQAFESKKAMIKEQEERNIQLEQEISQIRVEIERSQENVERFQREIENIQAEKAVARGVREHAISALQQLDVRKFESSTLEIIRQEKTQLIQRIAEIERTYAEMTQELHVVKTSLAEIAGQYGAAKDQLSHYNQQIKAKQEHIAKLLREFEFADITEVQTILHRPIDVKRIRQEIQQYFVKLEVMESQINSLREFLKDKAFSEEELNTTNQLFEFKKEELELQLALTGGLEKELAHITLEYGKKEKLVEEFQSINNRSANLKVLENLFKGNGFVNYVSSIHLRQMCEMANVRFHRLTRNQLSLALNDNNEFEVIDYLNNGYRRSVKTLSGGQSFQASLCLALALAESIQSLNKADRNFFFIDEGFGTQDAESIDTVFDTLQYLHRENRVVGIISHVEELKERIPRSITVSKDEEQGSWLHPSWNE